MEFELFPSVLRLPSKGKVEVVLFCFPFIFPALSSSQPVDSIEYGANSGAVGCWSTIGGIRHLLLRFNSFFAMAVKSSGFILQLWYNLELFLKARKTWT